jgi:drug/metabolite transporter superfamily protein YnfA
MDPNATKDFETAAQQPASGALGEVWLFLRHNRKWWLLPILIVLALFGLLTVLAGSGAAPFIYTLF